MLDRSLKNIVRIGIYRKGNTLAIGNTTYIGLIHVGNNLHLRQVGCNGEEGRRFETGGYSLPFLDHLVDNHTVDRAGDGSVFEVAAYFNHSCLVLLVSSLGFLVIISSRLVIIIADELLLVQDFASGIILLLILVLGLAAG